MTYVRKHGRPDLFVTFTCNPSWQEIASNLLEQQKPDQRHDIIARVFHLKLQKMMQLFTAGAIFGNVICHMYTVEWQKRGFPHAHILLWLREKLRPSDIDSVISAEFPDRAEDPVLYEVIKKNMVHGPCGQLNRSSKCMDKGQCTKHYLRQLMAETQTGEDGYPLYRRRKPEDGCKIFKAHINVEYCNSVKAIKYICKDVNKGSDRAVFEVAPQAADNQQAPRDEITMFQSGRYISTWRTANVSTSASTTRQSEQLIHLPQHSLPSLPSVWKILLPAVCCTAMFHTWIASKRRWQRRNKASQWRASQTSVQEKCWAECTPSTP
jgi:hypothetical protein